MPVGKMRKSSEHNWDCTLLVVGLLIGFGQLLAFPLNKPIWTDEWISINWGRQPLGDIIRGNFGSPDALPLHPLILHMSHVFGDNLLVARTVSAIPAVIALWFVYLLGSRISTTVGLLSLWLTAFSPGLILFDRMSRYHGTSALLCLVSLYFFFRWIDSGSSKDAWKYCGFTWLMLMSYVLTVFVVITQIMYVIWKWRTLSRPIMFILLYSLALCGFSVWFIPNYFRATQTLALINVEDPQIGLGIGGFLRRFSLPIYVFCVGETVYPWVWHISVPGCISGMALYIKGIHILRKRPEIVLPLVCIFVVAMSALITSGRMGGSQTFGSMAKRVSFVLPLFYITLASAVMSISRIQWRIIIIALLFGVSLYSLGNYWRGKQFINPNYTAPWNEVIEIMQKTRLDRNTTVFSAAEPALEYYVQDFKHDIPIVRGRKLGIILDSFARNPTRWIWVVGRDRGDRLSVSGFDEVQRFCRQKYRRICSYGVFQRSADELYWMKTVLNRPVWPYYIVFELYDTQGGDE